MSAGEWRCYRAVFAASSEIHIGWHDLGTIMRTRYYVPARNLWGVLVAGLAPVLGGSEAPGMYAETGKKLRWLARGTALFPVLLDARGAEVAEPCWPAMHAEYGMRWSNLSAEDFEREFVHSETSTAVTAATFTAEEGALHESEYLAPVGRSRRRLGFQGYVLLGEGLDARQVTEVLRCCQVGADRRYGWGRLRLIGDLTQSPAGEMFGCVKVAGSDPERGPLLESIVAPRWYLPAHLECEQANYEQYAGELEALSGRDWCRDYGPGKGVVRAKLCWAPGSRARPSKAPLRFWIEPQGVWRSAGGLAGGSMADPL